MSRKRMTEKEAWESGVQRFWAGVDKGSPDDCWEWQKETGTTGYGRIRIHHKKWRTHRVSWIIHFGDPGDKHVLHRCDNPPCCNPNHLFLGTIADNLQDMTEKGRRGSRLTEADVIEIKRRLASGERHKDIADSYGVHRTTISYINRGKTWKDIA